MLSKRALNLKPSPTLSLVAKAKELQAKGHDVISLTVGEPDWATFKKASDAGIEAIQKNITKYTAANGTIELRKKISENAKKEFEKWKIEVIGIKIGKIAQNIYFLW